jgi:phosphoribosylformylglycinamidine cyclo-ligase
VSDTSYAGAGVDLDKAERARARIGQLAATTRTAWSAGAIGAFGGMVRVPPAVREPLLVMSTDGVGTKVLVALKAGRFESVGEDLVNHSVNDILVHGAAPLAFLDYIAGHRLPDEMIVGIVEGIARGCRAHEMALVGGETAQMPGLYQAGTFDLAGTIVGVVEAGRVVDGHLIVPGDVLVAYASNGLHTNGYTLARQILFDRMGLALHTEVPELGVPLVDALLAVHTSYAAAIRPVLDRMHGLAHITGGGIAGNLRRVLPSTCDAVINPASWQWPALFRLLSHGGAVPLDEMRRVFNLGAGMIAAVPADAIDGVREAARHAGIDTWVCGAVQAGTGEVVFTG